VLAVPIGVGLATGLLVPAVFASIGCLNVLLVQFDGSARVRLIRSGWAVGLNTGAIVLGTLVGTLGWVEVPLVAVVLTFVHFANRVPNAANLSLVASVMFVIGVGLPGAGTAAALSRGATAFLGGGLAIVALGVEALARRAVNRTAVVATDAPVSDETGSLVGGVLPEWPHALAVGTTAAAGLAVALAVGLERDYWIMLTVIVVLRARFDQTLEVGAARMVGTVLGAALAAAVTVAVDSASVQAVLLVGFALAFFLLQRANYALYALALTAFIIVLLDLAYPAGLVLAETRVLDTFVGGALAMLAAAALWYLHYRPSDPAARGRWFQEPR
jgi:hypothetical protein